MNTLIKFFYYLKSLAEFLYLGFLLPKKIHRPQSGLKSRTLGFEANTLPRDHRGCYSMLILVENEINIPEFECFMFCKEGTWAKFPLSFHAVILFKFLNIFISRLFDRALTLWSSSFRPTWFCKPEQEAVYLSERSSHIDL